MYILLIFNICIVDSIKSLNAFIAHQNIQSMTCTTIILEEINIKYRTVKTLKSFGFIPAKGTNKVLISSLSKDKIKKLSNLRVI